MEKYINAAGKLDMQVMTADLLSMLQAVRARKKEFAKESRLPVLVRETYLEAHGVSIEQLT